jgi:hypothetical protein
MKINARCESVTNIIIKEMEAGAVPWVKQTPKVFSPPAQLCFGSYAHVRLCELGGAST